MISENRVENDPQAFAAADSGKAGKEVPKVDGEASRKPNSEHGKYTRYETTGDLEGNFQQNVGE